VQAEVDKVSWGIEVLQEKKFGPPKVTFLPSNPFTAYRQPIKSRSARTELWKLSRL